MLLVAAADMQSECHSKVADSLPGIVSVMQQHLLELSELSP